MLRYSHGMLRNNVICRGGQQMIRTLFLCLKSCYNRHRLIVFCPNSINFWPHFPTLTALATASTADVISVWVPLGYNRRAISLQSIARQVLERYAGRIPDTIDELLTLKGIGRYTAGAIACFAYHKQVATVDTNIRRVLHRVFLGLEHPDTQSQRCPDAHSGGAGSPRRTSIQLASGIMDMGATICSSGNPRCDNCPLQSCCTAYTEMSQYSLFPSGTVLRQIRKVAEKKTRYQAQPFTSTNRYFRGRIVDLLRTLPAQQRMPLHILGPRIKPAFSADDQAWLQQIIEKLENDGLIDVTEEGVRLP